MTDSEEKLVNPEVLRGEESFPLRLSSGPEKCTIVWSIAGFDPSSGAGVTADLLTFAAHGLFGCSAITALTVQSTLGVFASQPVEEQLLRTTLQRLEEDLPFAGLKIGMLGSEEIAAVVGQFLAKMHSRSAEFVVVLDPVLQSSSGKALFPPEGLSLLHSDVLPYVNWITPNWAEVGVLAGVRVRDLGDAEEAARKLLSRHPHLHIVATGGEEKAPTDLLLLPDGRSSTFIGEHVETSSTHGTGCAFSSALLAQLVLGAAPADAVQRAKDYVTGALRTAPGLGGGRGPMGLLWPLRKTVD